MRFLRSFSLLITLGMIAALVACGGSSHKSQPITVTLSAVPTSLQVSATQAITATVANDSANGGVTWSCTPGNSAATCGSFSSTTTASGTPVTYTAPATVPTSTVVITATSVTNSTISASTAAITITPVPVIMITLSATPTSMFVNDTTPVTATVTNDAANGGVTWSCAPAGTCGTFSSATTASGTAVIYTAPATVPASTVVITATSVTDNTISASAPPITVNLTSGFTVSLSTPPPSSMATNATATIAATTTDPVGVNWSCTPVGACGSFNPTNTVSTATTTYTAPATAGSVTVIATSISDNAINASAAVTITGTVGAPALAAGNYVFALSGEDANVSVYSVAGVFTVDSNGNITGGEQDFVDFITGPLHDTISGCTGCITTAANGDIQITLSTGDVNLGPGGTTGTGTGQEVLDLALTSIAPATSSGLLTEYDAWASGSGTLDLQTSTAAPSGGYAFFVAGLDGFNPPFQLAIGGVINVDTPGNISGAGSVFDQNDGGLLSSDQLYAGSTVSTPDSMGMVTFTLNPATPSSTVFELGLVGYIIDADHIRLVETLDSNLGVTGGTALGQNGKNGTYNMSSLSGSSGVFGASGTDSNGPLQIAGLLTFNADGSLSGNLSYNDMVQLTPQGGSTLAAGGTYTVDPSGRVTIANVSDGVNTFNFQLYLAHHSAPVISMDGTDAVAGLGYGQTGSFTAASFSGNYALNIDQQDTVNTNFGFEYDGVGSVTADGTSAFTGSLDQNIGLTATTGTVTGTFTADASGVFTGTITGTNTVTITTVDNFTFYLLGASSGASVGVIGIENDATDQLTLATFQLLQ